MQSHTKLRDKRPNFEAPLGDIMYLPKFRLKAIRIYCYLLVWLQVTIQLFAIFGNTIPESEAPSKQQATRPCQSVESHQKMSRQRCHIKNYDGAHTA